MNRIESCNFEAGAVQVGEVIHPLQQCLSDNGEKIAAAVTEAQFREVLAVNTELRGEAEKLKADCRNYLHEVEQLKAQRDELVNALADAVDYLNGPMNSIQHGSRLYSQMGEALACIEDVKP